MSSTTTSTQRARVPVSLDGRFARELPELALPWRAAEAPDPHALVVNDALAVELGLDPAWLRSEDGIGLLTGARLPDGATPVAQVYAGHQFGGYSPRLGDGRALLLGELTDPAGGVHDLHLKGSGRTPFARAGDGLAAVGPMLREHVISEAMHALGVPSTRTLAVVATGAPVQRETVLPGAVLARTAASHLRVGSFQYARSLDDVEVLRRLVDHAVARHHPHAARADVPALALLAGVAAAQADLVARWMLLGFVHGVMNTDNMTISGETIDYGPCAFMEAYDPRTVFSSIDSGARYAYGRQPAVASWNLARLAEALLPVVDDDQDRAIAQVTEVLEGFAPRYTSAWTAGLRAKLGLRDGLVDDVVVPLADELLGLMSAGGVDWTSAFRALGPAARGDAEPLRDLFLDRPAVDAWLERWRALEPDADLLARTNPAYVPRNHLVEEALDAATAGDLAPYERLVAVVTSPFEDRPGLERYAAPAPESFGAYTTYCGT